jgi:hypothetical protein
MAAMIAANDKDWRKDCVAPTKDTRVQTAVSNNEYPAFLLFLFF